MNLSSDQLIFWQHGFVKLNGTIVTTWVMMLAIAARRDADHSQAGDGRAAIALADPLEIIVTGIENADRGELA